jgi:pimeloyl-ACP methyl ester carboxylesterase
MNGATEATAERVVSSDGTEIAWWMSGEGPPLVLVHGSLCDHSHFDPLVAELREGMTTVSMDRRGFRASGDAVHRLVLYEPGLGISYPSGSIEEIEAAVAAGDLDTAALLDGIEDFVKAWGRPSADDQ